MSSNEARSLSYRVRFLLGEALGAAICEPQLRLGRLRHDNVCDECGERAAHWALERLEFGIDIDEVTFKQKLKAALTADYERYCLDCKLEEFGDD